MFHHGDRVRYATTGDDGFPVVRYGFVGGTTAEGGPVVVMLDGELGGDVVDIDTLQPVHISNVTLTLEGTDLLEDPALRQGLIHLWTAEAESAGLEISAMHPMDTGVRDSGQGFALAELTSADEPYVLTASLCPSDLDAVLVCAARPLAHNL
ncbi:MAG: hypothetical protein ACI83Y_000438 [Candidatus Azotimanducaceae bacterium]|jgi:hypothetical protein